MRIDGTERGERRRTSEEIRRVKKWCTWCTWLAQKPRWMLADASVQRGVSRTCQQIHKPASQQHMLLTPRLSRRSGPGCASGDSFAKCYPRKMPSLHCSHCMPLPGALSMGVAMKHVRRVPGKDWWALPSSCQGGCQRGRGNHCHLFAGCIAIKIEVIPAPYRAGAREPKKKNGKKHVAIFLPFVARSSQAGSAVTPSLHPVRDCPQRLPTKRRVRLVGLPRSGLAHCHLPAVQLPEDWGYCCHQFAVLARQRGSTW